MVSLHVLPSFVLRSPAFHQASTPIYMNCASNATGLNEFYLMYVGIFTYLFDFRSVFSFENYLRGLERWLSG